jgi:hypothetical protein
MPSVGAPLDLILHCLLGLAEFLSKVTGLRPLRDRDGLPFGLYTELVTRTFNR